MATLAERLAEAEAAYHTLQVGGAIARVRDQNGEEIWYTAANAGRLLAYIADLKQQLGTGTFAGPMRVVF